MAIAAHHATSKGGPAAAHAVGPRGRQSPAWPGKHMSGANRLPALAFAKLDIGISAGGHERTLPGAPGRDRRRLPVRLTEIAWRAKRGANSGAVCRVSNTRWVTGTVHPNRRSMHSLGRFEPLAAEIGGFPHVTPSQAHQSAQPKLANFPALLGIQGQMMSRSVRNRPQYRKTLRSERTH